MHILNFLYISELHFSANITFICTAKTLSNVTYITYIMYLVLLLVIPQYASYKLGVYDGNAKTAEANNIAWFTYLTGLHLMQEQICLNHSFPTVQKCLLM